MIRKRRSDHTERVLVVQAHPSAESFSAAALAAAEAGLAAAGHQTRVRRLYQEGFAPVMSRAEHVAYQAEQPVTSPSIAGHIHDLQWATTLVFVYPTWWSGPPAILKSWFERVMIPGVAFAFDEKSGKVRPNLRHVHRIVGIATYGSPRWAVWLAGDGGRRIVLRTLRMICSYRTRRTWIGLYDINRTTGPERAAFLQRVTQKMADL